MRRHRPLVRSAAVLAAAVLSIAGSVVPARAATRARIVTIEMGAIKYKPTTITVKTGQKVTFRFRNSSNLRHEALIADEKAQAEHEAMMKAMPEMADHGHAMGDEPYVSVAPGKTGTITTTFRKAGRLIIGCHQPGHYASGMRALLVIEKGSALG